MTKLTVKLGKETPHFGKAGDIVELPGKSAGEGEIWVVDTDLSADIWMDFETSHLLIAPQGAAWKYYPVTILEKP